MSERCEECGKPLEPSETFPGHFLLCSCVTLGAFRGYCVDSEGNRVEFRSVGGHGFSVSRDGVVQRWTEDEDGHREEWTEPLHESDVREVFGGWLWDLMVDPRNEALY